MSVGKTFLGFLARAWAGIVGVARKTLPKTITPTLVIGLVVIGTTSMFYLLQGSYWLVTHQVEREFEVPPPTDEKVESKRILEIMKKELIYGKAQVDMSADLAKSLITTVTGYLVLVASALGFIHKARLFLDRSNRVCILAILVSGLLSLTGWIMLLAILIDCSATPFGSKIEEQRLGQNLEWVVSILIFRIAEASFLFSIATASYLAFRLLSVSKTSSDVTQSVS